MGYSPPGSSVHGILQARILEWLPLSSPGDLSNPGIKPGSPALETDSLATELQGKPRIVGRLGLLIILYLETASQRNTLNRLFSFSMAEMNPS